MFSLKSKEWTLFSIDMKIGLSFFQKKKHCNARIFSLMLIETRLHIFRYKEIHLVIRQFLKSYNPKGSLMKKDSIMIEIGLKQPPIIITPMLFIDFMLLFILWFKTRLLFSAVFIRNMNLAIFGPALERASKVALREHMEVYFRNQAKLLPW